MSVVVGGNVPAQQWVGDDRLIACRISSLRGQRGNFCQNGVALRKSEAVSLLDVLTHVQNL